MPSNIPGPCTSGAGTGRAGAGTAAGYWSGATGRAGAGTYSSGATGTAGTGNGGEAAGYPPLEGKGGTHTWGPGAGLTSGPMQSRRRTPSLTRVMAQLQGSAASFEGYGHWQ